MVGATMARLTEEMVIARSKQSDLSAIKKLNCWGGELGDVSVLRKMPNVEVLALSINRIRSLSEFAGCARLRELYVRKNEIADLREIRHLRRLANLTSLWLDENPCTQHPQYRLTVLRNLPNLEKLDNVPVQPEEVSEAMRRGEHIPDSDDESDPQQQEWAQARGRGRHCSYDSSPERDHQTLPHPHNGSGRPLRHEASDGSEGAPEASAPAPPASVAGPAQEKLDQGVSSPPRRAPSPPTPESDERYEHPAMTRSHYEARSPPPAPLPHSLSQHSVKDYSYGSNGDFRYAGVAGGAGHVHSPPQQLYHDNGDRIERGDPHHQQRCPAETWERDTGSGRERDREYPSAVMGEHRGFTRRPVTRNSNLLSAVLCLVKELDYTSLEVAEMAVRCRMDELANSQ